MTRGIDIGVVKIRSINTQKKSETSMKRALNCRKISRPKIREKSINFRRQRAVRLVLKG